MHNLPTVQSLRETLNQPLGPQLKTLLEDRLADMLHCGLQNHTHRVVSGIEGRITDRLDMSRVGSPRLPKLTANQVLNALEIKNPTNAQSKEANVALRALLGDSKRSQGQNRWAIPWSKTPEPDGTAYLEDEDRF